MTRPDVSYPIERSPRFEIRELKMPQHYHWASLVIQHSNVYCGKVLPVLYPDDQANRFRRVLDRGLKFIEPSINTGLSYGVFDKEYQFKRPESAATGGAFYGDEITDASSGDDILQLMDFPLVSVAMAYDAFDPIPRECYEDMMELFPVMAEIYDEAQKMPVLEGAIVKPTGPKQLLLRNATSTRKDYEGRGLMKDLSHFLIREAARQGFPAIRMEMMNAAVKHVWLHPPSPYQSTLVGEFHIGDIVKKNEDGEECRPYAKVSQLMSRVYVPLQ